VQALLVEAALGVVHGWALAGAQSADEALTPLIGSLDGGTCRVAA
jgi:hypothetical protein